MRTIEPLRAAGAALLLCLAGCASAPRHPEAFSFAVMGDTPYTPAEVGPYHAMLKAIDAAPVAFVIHVGDITSGAGDCSEALYAQRKAEFDASAHPFIYTPGDNDWTDCRRTKKDPGERLERLRQVFFADRQSLGRARIEMSVQDRCADVACRCPAHPENRFWTRAGVRFVTLNIPGSNNNEGFDAAGDAEAACRNEANAQWLEQAVRASERSETRGLVIAIQADPWVGMKRVYEPFLRQVRDAARRLHRPVLLVHGDSHTLTIDTPLRDTFGNPIGNITRLETYGSPFVGWVKVTVDPDDPELFSFEPKLQALALSRKK
jgi:hypothetical protein